MKRILVLLSISFLLSSSPALGETCNGDFDCDGDSDGTDAATFKNDFGRSQFQDPCEPCRHIDISKTGYTTCYDYDQNPIDCMGTGQDGQYQRGFDPPIPRFTDHGDGTVTDNLTGLMWLQDANCMVSHYPIFDDEGTPENGAVTWYKALDFVAGINDGTFSDCGAGYNDWLLPNIRELHSLIDWGQANPALTSGHPFENVRGSSGIGGGNYWSSTSGINSNIAWEVYIGSGDLWNRLKWEAADYVWPIRGGRTGDKLSPTITIMHPTSEDTYSTSEDFITLAGDASDNIGVTSVTWSNNRGGSGTGSGTTNWTIANIELPCGEDNIITVISQDAADNIATDALIVDVKPCPPEL